MCKSRFYPIFLSYLKQGFLYLICVNLARPLTNGLDSKEERESNNVFSDKIYCGVAAI